MLIARPGTIGCTDTPYIADVAFDELVCVFRFFLAYLYTSADHFRLCLFPLLLQLLKSKSSSANKRLTMEKCLPKADERNTLREGEEARRVLLPASRASRNTMDESTLILSEELQKNCHRHQPQSPRPLLLPRLLSHGRLGLGFPRRPRQLSSAL